MTIHKALDFTMTLVFSLLWGAGSYVLWDFLTRSDMVKWLGVAFSLTILLCLFWTDRRS
jgi:hypothetical protein